jgi:hypothetical protein
MSGIQEQVGGAAPPDEWLALNEVERAELLRRAAELDLDEREAARWLELQIVAEPVTEPNSCCELPALPTIDDVLQSAESLALDDRIRLTGKLLVSLPVKDRAAIVTLGLESLEQSPSDARHRATTTGAEPFWTALWRVLFDPTNTGELYSAPRRFDLATIFVITAAYSILFGAITALDYGPFQIIVLGSIVTLIAVVQGWLHGEVNPRGASIVVGAAAYTLFSYFLWRAHPRAFFVNDIVYVVVINGLIGGAALGYLSGAVVGGVFLVADFLRGKLERRSPIDSNEDPFSGAD